MGGATVALSVVSHGQNALVNALLADLARLRRADLRVLVTINVPDAHALENTCGAEVIVNQTPAGFGANHNAAFHRSAAPFFCVVNPDIRLREDPFPTLAAPFEDPQVGITGPLVVGREDRPEDSARRFPTAGSLLRKLLRGAAGPEYPVDRGALRVDWVAGMFMQFRSDAFRAARGFDERFFLYYEDVDICRRLAALGYACVFQPAASVVHNARRASRRDPRLMAIHGASLARYLARRYR
jgi:N-acetylglucosaminyl-diphospho-decaprenol L-rhamnosyltransferase